MPTYKSQISSTIIRFFLKGGKKSIEYIVFLFAVKLVIVVK